MTKFVLQGPAPIRDPHVAELTYAVHGQKGVEYAEGTAHEHKDSLGVFRIADGKLRVAPAQHFSTVEEARAVIDPYLRAWETASDLRVGPGSMRFQFEREMVVDLDTSPHDESTPRPVRATLQVRVSARVDLASKVVRSKYPEPPSDFELTPEVKAMNERWTRCCEGREPLLTTAYYVLTLLEAYATASSPPGRAARAAAAANYAIDVKVLSRIGLLSTTRGDFSSGRKFDHSAAPLTADEAAWLEAAVRLLILRMGEHAAAATTGKQLRLIGMADLPPLP